MDAIWPSGMLNGRPNRFRRAMISPCRNAEVVSNASTRRAKPCSIHCWNLALIVCRRWRSGISLPAEDAFETLHSYSVWVTQCHHRQNSGSFCVVRIPFALLLHDGVGHDSIKQVAEFSKSKLNQGVSGGGGGIRTLGALPPADFQDQCFQPLSHPSEYRKPTDSAETESHPAGAGKNPLNLVQVGCGWSGSLASSATVSSADSTSNI